jgi:gluconate:H+ symporter, GntP family
MVGLAFAYFIDARMPLEMRPVAGQPMPKPLPDRELPPLWLSLAPVLLPVVLISASTVLKVYADAEPTTVLQAGDIRWTEFQQQAQQGLASDQPTPAKRVAEKLDDQSRSFLGVRNLQPGEQEILREGLNRVLRRRDFYQESAFFGVPLTPVARSMITLNREQMQLGDLQRLNRALLESAFPEAIEEHQWETPRRRLADLSSLVGNANFALLLSAIIAIVTLGVTRKLTRAQVGHAVEESLMSGGVIILITAAGGAFGAMLTAAGVGEAIKQVFAGVGADAGLVMLVMGFGVSAVLKTAQGSTTVAMITTSGMLAGIASVDILGFHPVYLATSIGCGGLVGSWMNDSGFWVFSKMGGLTEEEALKSWSIGLVLMGVTGLATSLALALLLPMRG